MSKKLVVAFVCVHNSCRSQMAEAMLKHIDPGLFDVYSAGTENYPEVKPGAVTVMEELGVDMSKHYPKLLTDIPRELDILITMGCNVQCPFVPHRFSEDWGLEDPSGGPLDGFRETRDTIRQKCEALIASVQAGTLPLSDTV